MLLHIFCNYIQKCAAVFLRPERRECPRGDARFMGCAEVLTQIYIEPYLDLTFNIYYSNSKYNILIYGVNTNVRQLREDAGKWSGTAELK